MPYLYLTNPIQLGDVKFSGIPDFEGRRELLPKRTVAKALNNLSRCFPAKRGLSTNKGAVQAFTYFCIDYRRNREQSAINKASKAIELFRYMILRPSYNAIDNIESTYTYIFFLPPITSNEYSTYRCWPNLNEEQEIWVSPKHDEFPPPGWYVELQLLHDSELEDVDQIQDIFYKRKMPAKIEDETLLAIQWYNQSFEKYSIRHISSKLVDIATAFETLFGLWPSNTKTKDFISHISKTFGLQDNPLVKEWAKEFYVNVRSRTIHAGKPDTLAFKHPQAQKEHIGYLGLSRRIFRECLAEKMGLARYITSEKLIDELTPNEIYIKLLREAGSFKNIQKKGLLKLVQKLRQVYPTGNREDIIWIGKELLQGYKEKYVKKGDAIIQLLEDIIGADDDGSNIALKYCDLAKEMSPISLGYVVMTRGDQTAEESRKIKPKRITRDNIDLVSLEMAIHDYAEFACHALLIPT